MIDPEKLKRGLKCCGGFNPCDECPYNNDPGCTLSVCDQALKYIAYLEDKLKAYEV